MPRLGLYGGAEGFGWRLAEALAARGHEVRFLCARAEGRLPQGVVPVELGRPPLGRAVKNLWFAWAVERHLAANPYDLVMGLSRTWNQDILRVGGGPQEIFNRLTLAAHGEGLSRLGKRLRRTLDDYERNVPPHVRAARTADDYNDQQGRPRQYQNGGWISYVITVAGPEPLEIRSAPIDYDHYVTRQLQPVADAILPFVDDDFSTLIGGQLGLF